MTGTPALTLRGVRLRYGHVVALHDVSLAVPAGSLTAVVGPSGCGKTSLLRVAAGFERPESGVIELDGQAMCDGKRWVPPERRGVGMVFQEGALFPHLTVRGNVLFGLHRAADAARRARSVLELVGLAGLDHRYPDELSGGQQQRVALARALAPSPRVVLLDEPFANLDAVLRQRVRDEVAAILRAARATALLVTHDQEEALSVADRVAVMRDGRVLQAAPPQELYRRPCCAAVAEFIGDGQLLACRLAGGRLQCVLGPATGDGPEGDAWLLVRPEEVVLADPATAATSGRVAGRRFHGHDVVVTVRLDEGTTVRVRALGEAGPAIGELVGLRLRPGRYPLFAADGDGRRIGECEPVVRARRVG